MAEIVPFTPRPDPAGAGAAGLAEALFAAFAAGADLGPRGTQIRGLGLSLDQLVAGMRARLADLDVALASRAIPASSYPGVRAMLGEVERLAALATSYGAGDGGPSTGA